MNAANLSKDVAVLYHGNCADGFGAAYAAWLYYGHEKANYIPVTYGRPPPNLDSYRHVFIVDFSYPREILETMAALRDIIVIDHHKTAQAALEGLPYCIFDMDHSGAVLTWRYFFEGSQKPMPPLLEYIEDRDLWHFKLPLSREVSAALWSYPMEFTLWDNLKVSQLGNEGQHIIRYMVQQTVMICHQACMWRVGPHTAPVVNATSLWSEVGHQLLEMYPDAPFVASYYDTARGTRKWSLRSRADFDCSEVAAKLGGGGHAQASGFDQSSNYAMMTTQGIDVSYLPERIIKTREEVKADVI